MFAPKKDSVTEKFLADNSVEFEALKKLQVKAQFEGFEVDSFNEKNADFRKRMADAGAKTGASLAFVKDGKLVVGLN